MKNEIKEQLIETQVTHLFTVDELALLLANQKDDVTLAVIQRAEEMKGDYGFTKALAEQAQKFLNEANDVWIQAEGRCHYDQEAIDNEAAMYDKSLPGNRIGSLDKKVA
jgi:hypothetical protein